MSERYIAMRDAQITVSLLTHGKHESMPSYVTGTRPETVTSAGPRQAGGMSAEQLDRIFPVWASQYPGRVSVQR